MNRFRVLDEDYKDVVGFDKEIDAVNRAKTLVSEDASAQVFYVAEIIGEAKRTSPPALYMRLPPPSRPKKKARK